MRIAVLGMGRMGRALALRLLEGGHSVVVWNRSKGKAAEVVAAGGTEADTIRQAVTDVELAMTSLANDDAVRAVALGEDGIRASIGDGDMYVDTSTVSPRLSAELADAFPAFAAMPILGSPAAVRAGQAMYLVGGPDDVVDRLEPVLKSLTERARRYDRAPLASTAKLTCNLLLLAGVVALAEAFTVGRSGGLTDDQLRELLGGTPLVAPALKNRFEGILTGEQEAWWTTVLGAKDARLAAEVAADAGIDLPLAKVVRERLEAAAAAGFDDEDIAAVARLYR
jgi:3-hydroxyisobutyrate dehydrogenase